MRVRARNFVVGRFDSRNLIALVSIARRPISMQTAVSRIAPRRAVFTETARAARRDARLASRARASEHSMPSASKVLRRDASSRVLARYRILFLSINLGLQTGLSGF